MRKLFILSCILVLGISLTSCDDNTFIQYTDSEGKKVKYVFEETYDKEQIYNGLEAINNCESKSNNKNVKVNGSLNLNSDVLNIDFYLETTKSNYDINDNSKDLYLEYDFKYKNNYTNYSYSITKIDTSGTIYYENDNFYISSDGSYGYKQWIQTGDKSFSYKYNIDMEDMFNYIDGILDANNSSLEDKVSDSIYNNQVLDFIHEYCLSIKNVNKENVTFTAAFPISEIKESYGNSKIYIDIVWNLYENDIESISFKDNYLCKNLMAPYYTNYNYLTCEVKLDFEYDNFDIKKISEEDKSNYIKYKF